MIDETALWMEVARAVAAEAVCDCAHAVQLHGYPAPVMRLDHLAGTAAVGRDVVFCAGRDVSWKTTGTHAVEVRCPCTELRLRKPAEAIVRQAYNRQVAMRVAKVLVG